MFLVWLFDSIFEAELEFLYFQSTNSVIKSDKKNQQNQLTAPWKMGQIDRLAT